MESEIRADHIKGKVIWTLDPDIALVYAQELYMLSSRSTGSIDQGFLDDARALDEAAAELTRDDDDD